MRAGGGRRAAGVAAADPRVLDVYRTAAPLERAAGFVFRRC